MPEIPKTEYVPPVQPVPQQPTPQPAPPSYCGLATYNTVILRALLPDFVRDSIPGWGTRVDCSEVEARRVLDEVLRRPEIVRAGEEARRRWEAARPAESDAAAMRAWWRAQPPRLLSPAEWERMSVQHRADWTAQVRGWIATGPEPLPETVWSQIARHAQRHSHVLAAVGAGLVVLAAAALGAAAKAAGKRGSAAWYAIPPRRLPSVESEIVTHGYDRYDHLR